LSVNATGNLGFVIPTYVFETPVLGGQASVSLIGAYGVVGTSLAGTLSGVITGPFGNSVPFARSDTISDTTWGFGDLIPQFALRWNAGVHNYMTYITGDIPVGAYQSNRLSNLGIGHGAIDAGCRLNNLVQIRKCYPQPKLRHHRTGGRVQLYLKISSAGAGGNGRASSDWSRRGDRQTGGHHFGCGSRARRCLAALLAKKRLLPANCLAQEVGNGEG
jgi:hypothetical protein